MVQQFVRLESNTAQPSINPNQKMLAANLARTQKSPSRPREAL